MGNATVRSFPFLDERPEDMIYRFRAFGRFLFQPRGHETMERPIRISAFRETTYLPSERNATFDRFARPPTGRPLRTLSVPKNLNMGHGPQFRKAVVVKLKLISLGLLGMNIRFSEYLYTFWSLPVRELIGAVQVLLFLNPYRENDVIRMQAED